MGKIIRSIPFITSMIRWSSNILLLKNQRHTATSEVVGSKLATYFSLVTFLGVNLICFILVVVLYVDIFNTIRKTSERHRVEQLRRK